MADGRTLTFDEETHFYNELGLPYIPPELRQGKGETEVGLEQGLPDLVAEKDIRGDLHVHSQWSDGHCTIGNGRSGKIERIRVRCRDRPLPFPRHCRRIER